VSFTLHHGDCLDVLRTMPGNSVDSIVTDPPYGLSFMGKKWDYDVPATEVWAECLRVLKPGGHLLAFAGTRTQHRMAVRIEDAGFEIRDMIAWVYGSGFPKSHNGPWGGTALKPALEPITMARKPLAGTVQATWETWGTGALNIDVCRVATDSSVDDARLGGAGSWKTDKAAQNVYEGGYAGENIASSALGRWPANLIHDGSGDVLVGFPDTGASSAGMRGIQQRHDVASPETARPKSGTDSVRGHEDAGGSAARFFYTAKASKEDRDAGLHGFDKRKTETMNGYTAPSEGRTADKNGGPKANIHPTVKPTDLMRYLVRLVTPPGGTVLDPFNGSGSTGKAAILEGLRYIGCEREAEYIAISRARIEHAQALLAAGMDKLVPASERDAHTVDLFA
jgi:DNA modification methylase